MDLVVDLNFRMDTTALYSDVVLPVGELVREGRSQHHRPAQLHPSAGRRGPSLLGVADRLGHLPRPRRAHQRTGAGALSTAPFRDVVATPLLHDTPDEIAQPAIRDWTGANASQFPARRCRTFRWSERDYVNLVHHMNCSSDPG